MNQQIRLKQRPAGRPAADSFEMVEKPIPQASEGQVLCRTIYLSLDPYMRMRMIDAKSYAPPVEIGQVMVGGTVSQVVESRFPGLAAGDFVVGYDGWQQYATPPGKALRPLDPRIAPISTALGVLGMPGMTAYVGLLDIGRPQPGETVVVSAASGAVGAVVGQIAKIHGCRAVGIAGSHDKCEYVTGGLGFDACVDYKAPNFAEALREACPQGVDVYFDNVGGAVTERVLPLMNQNGRIPLCGMISQYNATPLPAGPNLAPVLTKRLTIKGFIVTDHADRAGAFFRDASAWIRDGRLKYREDIVEGLENAPSAFLRLFDGSNFGKLLVKVGADPTRDRP